MPHTYTHLLIHIVFATKGRERIISADMRPLLYSYIGGIIRELKGALIAINGMEDHIHLLISMHPTLSISELVRVVKANSSKWTKEKWPQQAQFAWQEGYGAFSVSESAAKDVALYIANQEEHHRRRSFQDEFIALLRKHNITYDERYIWD